MACSLRGDEVDVARQIVFLAKLMLTYIILRVIRQDIKSTNYCPNTDDSLEVEWRSLLESITAEHSYFMREFRYICFNENPYASASLCFGTSRHVHVYLHIHMPNCVCWPGFWLSDFVEIGVAL